MTTREFAALSLLLFALASPSTASALADASVDVARFEFEHDGERAIGRPTGLRFRAFGEDYELELERNEDLVAAGAKLTVVGDAGSEGALAPSTWIGRAAGRPDVEARLVIEGSRARGTLRSRAGTFAFEPSSSGTAPAGSHEIRRAEDLLAAAGPLACGADPSEVVPLPAVTAGHNRGVQRIVSRTLGVSVVADAAFYRRFGAQAALRMQALLNEVDGVFRSDLGIALQIVQMVIYQSDAAQPFSATAPGGELLSQLSAARAADSAQVLSLGGVTHLFSGRGLDGPSGIAWIAGVCDAHYGAGISSITSSPGFLEAILVAHEIGHNMGASHDGPLGYGCDSTTFGWIMWPLLDGGLGNSFSSCSRTRIAKQIPLAPCIGEAAPITCGNGKLDDAEACDDGNILSGDCCRADCQHDAIGMPCGDSGEACFDAVCDGAGSCGLIANQATCASDDACMEGRCSNGSCITTGEQNGFEEISVKFHVGDDGALGTAKLVASIGLLQPGSDPTTDGLEIVTTVGETTIHNEFIPPGRWTFKSAGNYSYKATSATPGAVKSAKVRYSPMTGRATLRFSMNEPMVALAPDRPTIFVLVGGRSDGQCGTSDPLRCTWRGTNYTCE